MTALEIRLIAYLMAGISVVGGTSWATHTIDAHHYERLEAADKLAQASALQVQQQKTIADLQAQQAATAAAETRYVELKKASDATAGQLADSVRQYAQLRRGLVSATTTAAALADAASQGANRDSKLASLVRSATEACQGDAAQLSALQLWAKGTAETATR